MRHNYLSKFADMFEPEGAPLEDNVHKVADITNDRGPWIRAAQLPKLFCSWDLAYRCTKGGWLTPIVKGKRRTIYRLADVLACMQRIEAGELPRPRRNKAAQQHTD
jgi:hypothetical protein